MRQHKDKQASLHFTAGYILYNCVCDEYKSWNLKSISQVLC